MYCKFEKIKQPKGGNGGFNSTNCIVNAVKETGKKEVDKVLIAQIVL